jgi:hypothetical protein
VEDVPQACSLAPGERPGWQSLALLSPSDSPARSLRGTVDVVKKLRHGSLQASQLPDLLRDDRGEIHRPRAVLVNHNETGPAER